MSTWNERKWQIAGAAGVAFGIGSFFYNRGKTEAQEDPLGNYLRIGDEAPNFVADTTTGKMEWHNYIANKWAILFSHPADFTPVCTTEIGRLSQLEAEFTKRNTVVAVVSIDDVTDHKKWVQEINRVKNTTVNFPIIGDETKAVARKYGMLDQTHLDQKGMPMTVRSVYVVGPDKKIKLILTYPASTGRNFDEIIRALDSLQVTAFRKMATPADWETGDRLVLWPQLSDDECRKYSDMNLVSSSCKLRTVPYPEEAAIPPKGRYLRIGDVTPDFTVDTSVGKINWHSYIDGKWGMLMSHPKDFTPVCTTEIGRVSQLKNDLADRNVVVAVVSVDDVADHKEWIKEINKVKNTTVDFPIIGDETKKVATLYGMLDQTHLDQKGLPLTVRSVFLIGPDKKIRLMLTYPATTGRNFDEIIRCIDSLQLGEDYPMATPADWQVGEPVVLYPNVSDNEAKKYPGLKVESASCKLRMVPFPTK